MVNPAGISLEVHDHREPVEVIFRGLSYASKSSKGNPPKDILKNISGSFNSGDLTAILGPSGAGKSSLLNVLSGFKFSGVTGSILYNESPIDDATRKICSYVPQNSEMLENLTVLETMNAAASLKLGRNLERRARQRTIEDVLQTLNMSKCSETRVKKLSGGELKRLSIAVEMITNPPVMYFDEPTSGLDSSSSLQVMSHLRELAKSGRTVICTIHQPSSRILELIDSVYLISNGQCLYGGPLDEMVQHFQLANYYCPPQYNRADFALEVASHERQGDYEKLLMITEKWGSAEKENEGDIKKEGQLKDTPIRTISKEYRANFWDQTVVLTGRSLRDAFRSLLYCQLRIIETAIIAVLIGSIFWKIGENADNMRSNASCIYFFHLYILVSHAMLTVLIFPFDRKVFMREHLNNWYSVGAYVLSKIISNLPIQIICPTIFISIAYFMTGQPMDWGRFFLLWFILLLSAVLADSLGMLIGSIFDVQMGTMMICAVVMPFFLFSGFFIRYSELPVFYRPIYEISFLRLGFEGSLDAVYGFNRSDLPCEGVKCAITSPAEFLQELDYEESFWDNVVGLGAWTITLWVLLYASACIRLKKDQ